jgi:CubicO group peptidase (beta-lactamase class C family)
MKRHLYFLFNAATALLIVASSSYTLAQSNDEDYITRIAANLSPNMVKEGEAIHGKSLAETMAEDHVTAVSIAVIRHGRLAWSRSFGALYPGGPTVVPDTLFQAGSISKPITAVAALRLVQQGKLSLDADVNSSLIHWKLPPSDKSKGNLVTLRELLSHTAGINVHGFPGYAAGTPVPTVLQVLDGIPPATNSPVRIESSPGKQWDYSGGGYVIVQQMIADVTGRPFADVLRDTVLRPYGMTHSSFRQPLPSDALRQAAMPYDADGTPIVGGPHVYPELAAAGLWTTADDLAHFLISTQQAALHGNSVLNASTARRMITPGLGDWGLGLEIGGQADHRYFWHGGGNAGYQCIMTAYEGEGDGAVVMTNGDRGYPLANDVIRSIAREYNWPDWGPRVVRVVRVDPALLQQYVGTYKMNQWFSFVVTFHDSGLFIQGTGQPNLELWPESDTRFTFVVDVDVEFLHDSNGKITGMNVLQDGKTMLATKQ